MEFQICPLAAPAGSLEDEATAPAEMLISYIRGRRRFNSWLLAAQRQTIGICFKYKTFLLEFQIAPPAAPAGNLEDEATVPAEMLISYIGGRRRFNSWLLAAQRQTIGICFKYKAFLLEFQNFPPAAPAGNLEDEATASS